MERLHENELLNIDQIMESFILFYLRNCAVYDKGNDTFSLAVICLGACSGCDRGTSDEKLKDEANETLDVEDRIANSQAELVSNGRHKRGCGVEWVCNGGCVLVFRCGKHKREIS